MLFEMQWLLSMQGFLHGKLIWERFWLWIDYKGGLVPSELCFLCKEDEESLDYIFLYCARPKCYGIWFYLFGL